MKRLMPILLLCLCWLTACASEPAEPTRQPSLELTLNGVVLMHDCYSDTVDAVERILQWGLENGYSFQPLSPESPLCQHDFLNN